MELKNFQKQVLTDLNNYCELVNKLNSVSGAFNEFWREKNVRVGIDNIPVYKNIIENTPHVCFKVPTGGGKTFIACNSLKIIFDNLPADKTKVVLWLVPSEAILAQTIKNLSNPAHPYRQKLQSDFNGRVQIYTKQQVLDGQQFNPTILNEQLSVIVMSFDSFRIRNKEGRKVYQENGNLQSFLDVLQKSTKLLPDVEETALMQVFHYLSPVVIVDESHHTTGELSIEMLRNLNPSFILDLTATPRSNSNIISYVDAMQLKAEHMVKLPVILYNRPSQEDVIADALDLRNKLEELSKDSDKYIRPIVLFQAQPKVAENKETFEKLKQKLIDNGIPEDEIAIKTAEINELKDIELDKEDCKIRYIITVNALKEGWDCPFAYILATLANKTSVVDVEQILGRVLRLPYTRQNPSKFLNLSYVLTSSNDFNETIKKVIKGLNDAGFSQKDYRVAEKIEPVVLPKVEQTSLPVEVDDEEFLQFDNSVLSQMINKRNDNGDALTKMLETAEEKSNNYEEELKVTETQVLGDLPLEVKSKVTTFKIEEEFKEEVLKLAIPQFYIKTNSGLFSMIDPEAKDMLTKEDLEEGFSLKDKDTNIDFESATENVIEIDVQKNEQPRYRQMAEKDSKSFKEMLQTLPPESRINSCKLMIKRELERNNSISNKDILPYIDRIIDNMKNDELVAMQNNINGFILRIKNKIELLLADHRKNRFKNLLETGKLFCIPSFKFKSEIVPGSSFNSLYKSLYISEQEVNGFELRVIEKVESLPNVKWWHRNIDRNEFCINGYINHYPDFIVYTNSGKIVLIETKGAHLTSNDDSKMKAELGKVWQSQAGPQFRYYMVTEDQSNSNPDAYTFDEFLKIMKEL